MATQMFLGEFLFFSGVDVSRGKESSNPSSPKVRELEVKIVIDLAAERTRRVEPERLRRTLKYQDLPLIGPNRLAVEYLKVA